MPAPIDYNTFLANVNADDLAMLTTFIVGVDVQAVTGAPEADALFVQAQRLYSAGLLTNLHRIYQDVSGTLVQSFRGLVAPQAAAYVAQLARERVTLSRAPIPVVPAP